jgi:putative membrane protein (TIGR04086 family)
LGALVGGAVAGLCHKQKGLLIGAVCGTLMALILLVVGWVHTGGVALGYAALKWAVLTVCSAAGGLWSVNRR